jgi:hypothetical protein
MGDFVAKMAKQSAIGFAQIDATAFALGVVGFGYVDSNQTVFMAGHFRRPAGDIGNEFKTQFWAAISVIHRQTEAENRIDDAALGNFQLVPSLAISLH